MRRSLREGGTRMLGDTGWNERHTVRGKVDYSSPIDPILVIYIM